MQPFGLEARVKEGGEPKAKVVGVPSTSRGYVTKLTPRELEALIVAARPNYERMGYIARTSQEMNISPHTVKVHVKNIGIKIQAAGIFSIVLKCLNEGIISLDDLGQENLIDLRSQLPFLTDGQHRMLEMMYEQSISTGFVDTKCIGDMQVDTVKAQRFEIYRRFRISNPAPLAVLTYLVCSKDGNEGYARKNKANNQFADPFSEALLALNFGTASLDKLGDNKLQDIKARLHLLTDGQLRVLKNMYDQSLVMGHVATKCLSNLSDLSPNTIRSHIRQMRSILRISTRSELAAAAYIRYGNRGNGVYYGNAPKK